MPSLALYMETAAMTPWTLCLPARDVTAVLMRLQVSVVCRHRLIVIFDLSMLFTIYECSNKALPCLSMAAAGCNAAATASPDACCTATAAVTASPDHRSLHGNRCHHAAATRSNAVVINPAPLFCGGYLSLLPVTTD